MLLSEWHLNINCFVCLQNIHFNLFHSLFSVLTYSSIHLLATFIVVCYLINYLYALACILLFGALLSGTSGLALIMRFRRKVCYANFLFGDFSSMIVKR